MTGKSESRYDASSPREISRRACFVESMTRSPTRRDAEHAVAPTTKTSHLQSREQTPSGVVSASIARAAETTSASAEPSPRARRRLSVGVPGLRQQIRASDVRERRNPILASVLRRVQRLVGGPEERGGRRAVERVGRDAGAHAKGETGVGQAVREHLPQPRSERGGEVGVRAREHDDELVAAEPRGLGARGQRPHEHAPDLVQERVAELVPGAVVDLLEVVAVDDEHAQWPAQVLRDGELALELLLEPAAVEDPRQRVRDRAPALELKGGRGVEARRHVSREHRGRVELDGIDSLVGSNRRHERAQIGPARPERKPDERAEPPCGARRPVHVEELADDVRIHERARHTELGLREGPSVAVVRAPRRELDRRPVLVPDDDLAHVGRQHSRERCGGEAGDLVGVTQPAQMHEQPRERGQVERAAHAKRLRERSEDRREWADELRHALRERTL